MMVFFSMMLMTMMMMISLAHTGMRDVAVEFGSGGEEAVSCSVRVRCPWGSQLCWPLP